MTMQCGWRGCGKPAHAGMTRMGRCDEQQTKITRNLGRGSSPGTRAGHALAARLSLLLLALALLLAGRRLLGHAHDLIVDGLGARGDVERVLQQRVERGAPTARGTEGAHVAVEDADALTRVGTDDGRLGCALALARGLALAATG